MADGTTTRRDLLKKGAVAGGLVWATPLVVSAARAKDPGTPLDECAEAVNCAHCEGSDTCGGSETCLCSTDTEGRCFCADTIICPEENPNARPCTTSVDCAPLGLNFHCVETCCEDPPGTFLLLCVPECGTTQRLGGVGQRSNQRATFGV